MRRGLRTDMLLLSLPPKANIWRSRRGRGQRTSKKDQSGCKLGDCGVTKDKSIGRSSSGSFLFSIPVASYSLAVIFTSVLLWEMSASTG